MTFSRLNFLGLACVLSTLMGLQAQAQFSETIRTGRPGQSIGPYAVGKGVLQFQQGIEHHNFDGPFIKLSTFSNNHVVRFGVSKRIEVSGLINHSVTQPRVSNLIQKKGLTDIHLGFRVNLNSQQGVLPSTGFQARLALPKVSEDYGSEYLAPNMVFVASWTLPKDMGITTNWILTYDGNSPSPIGQYILNFSFPIYGNWSGFIENYGTRTNTSTTTFFDGGLAYLVNNNLQLDASGGYSINNETETYFINAGISWRILNYHQP